MFQCIFMCTLVVNRNKTIHILIQTQNTMQYIYINLFLKLKDEFVKKSMAAECYLDIFISNFVIESYTNEMCFVYVKLLDSTTFYQTFLRLLCCGLLQQYNTKCVCVDDTTTSFSSHSHLGVT